MADDPIPGSAAGSAADALGKVESGLNALFAVELAEEVLEAVDFEALESGAPPEEVLDREQLRATMGEPVGRVLARAVASRAVGGGLPGVLGRELAGRAGATLLRGVLEDVDAEGPSTASDESITRDPANDDGAVRIEVERLEDA